MCLRYLLTNQRPDPSVPVHRHVLLGTLHPSVVRFHRDKAVVSQDRLLFVSMELAQELPYIDAIKNLDQPHLHFRNRLSSLLEQRLRLWDEAVTWEGCPHSALRCTLGTPRIHVRCRLYPVFYFCQTSISSW